MSEGRDADLLAALSDCVREHLLDVHSDPDHNRSVFTLIGEDAPCLLASRAMQLMDINNHSGVHPRLGIIDVVPFVPLFDAQWSDAVRARNDFAQWAAEELHVPCFLYGDERTLPDIRRTAWQQLVPDTGPTHPHSTAGAMCVGVRQPLIAYNIWLEGVDLATTKKIATAVRTESIRTLGLQVGEFTQVSINLVDPGTSNPADAFDAVRQHVLVHHCELVGLLPEGVLRSIPTGRWEELDLAEDRTIEWRLQNR